MLVRSELVFRILIFKNGYDSSLAIPKSYADQNLKVHTDRTFPYMFVFHIKTVL